MDKKFTDEEVVEAALCCTAKSCNTCPFTVLGVGFEKCVIKFSEYIANSTKAESKKQSREQEPLSDFDYYISQMFTADQRKAYDVGKSYQALKQLTKLAGEQSD